LIDPRQSRRSPGNGNEKLFKRQIIDLVGHIPHIAADRGRRQTNLRPYPSTSATLMLRPSLTERRADSARASACKPSSAEGYGALPVSSASMNDAIYAAYAAVYRVMKKSCRGGRL